MRHYSYKAVHSKTAWTFILSAAIIFVAMTIALYLHHKNLYIKVQVEKAESLCQIAENFKPGRGCEFSVATSKDDTFKLNFVRRDLLEQDKLNNTALNYYSIDRSNKLLLFTSFVRARKTCLECHGDPRKSKKLWAQGNDVNQIPLFLIGLKEDDICGTYEAVADIDRIDKQAAISTLIAETILFAGICIYSLALFGIVQYVIKRGWYKQKADAQNDSQIYDFDIPASSHRLDRIADEHTMSSGTDQF